MPALRLAACAWTLVGVLCDVLLAGTDVSAYVKGGPLAMCSAGAWPTRHSCLLITDGTDKSRRHGRHHPSRRLFILCADRGTTAGLPPVDHGQARPRRMATALLAHAAPVLACGRVVIYALPPVHGRGRGSTFVIAGLWVDDCAFSLFLVTVSPNTALGTFVSLS